MNVFPNESATIRYLVEIGVMNKSVVCPGCGNAMDLVVNSTKQVFRFSRESCGHRQLSCRTGSIFFGSKLKIRKIMRIARCWLQGETHGMAVRSTRLNAQEIRTWYTAFRELVSYYMREHKNLIGGTGMIVEIDETLLGRRKNNRGHHVEGAWVITGIERGTLKRGFGAVVERRDKETIRKIVSENVCTGSVVYTDEWKGYIGLDEACGVVHQTVCHSKFFRDPVSGVCTNSVEGLNGSLKHSIPPRFRNNQYASHFVDQYFWKRSNSANLCASFIQVLKYSLLDN